MTLNQLEQYRDLSKEVKMLERRIADLESRPEVFVSDSVVGSSPCIPYQPHTIAIKGYGNQYQDKIKAFIESLQDSRLRQIIEYRYVKGMPWNVVAKNVYGYPNGNTARMAVIRFFEKS